MLRGCERGREGGKEGGKEGGREEGKGGAERRREEGSEGGSEGARGWWWDERGRIDLVQQRHNVLSTAACAFGVGCFQQMQVSVVFHAVSQLLEPDTGDWNVLRSADAILRSRIPAP